MPFGKDRVDFVVVVVILLLLWTVVALEGAVRMELVEPEQPVQNDSPTCTRVLKCKSPKTNAAVVVVVLG
jgi:hypothetical protein